MNTKQKEAVSTDPEQRDGTLRCRKRLDPTVLNILVPTLSQPKLKDQHQVGTTRTRKIEDANSLSQYHSPVSAST